MGLLWVVSFLVIRSSVDGYQLSAGLATQPFLMPSGAQYRFSILTTAVSELIEASLKTFVDNV